VLDEAAHLLERVYLGNSVLHWLQAGIAFVAVMLVAVLLQRLFERRRQHHQGDRQQHGALKLALLLIRNTRGYVRVIVGLYMAKQFLTLPPFFSRPFDVIIVGGMAVQLAIWATTALSHQVRHRAGSRGESVQVGDAPIGVLLFVGQAVIWSLALLFALDNLGINITALVAGLGVGGIAIALSVQAILGDLLGSLSIAFDRPFQAGDTLRIDDIEGKVERVTVRSTRLRSVTGEMVILSNADILKARLRNLGRMPERRVLFRLQVAYDNSTEKVEQVAALVRGVVESQPGTRFGYCSLVLLGLSALEFEVVYHVANRADVNYVGTIDAVNRGILREFAAAGMALAYPTQRVLVDTKVGS
jgi:small-conductance mechanosensitive channel